MLRLRLPVDPANVSGECAQQWRFYASRQKRRRSLDLLTPTVLKRYAAYALHAGDAGALSPSPYLHGSADGALLYSCYSSGSGADREVVDAVRKVAAGHCPYCCLRLRTRPKNKRHDNDHHLPRSRFPEFSILSINLVTSCHDCNTHKSAVFATNTGVRRFLHPYFDACLEHPLVEARVSAGPGGVPVIKFQLTQYAATCPYAAIIQTHVEYFDVLERLADEAIGEITRHLQSLASANVELQLARESLLLTASTQLASRPNDPFGHALKAAALSTDLPELLREASSRLPPSRQALAPGKGIP